MSFRYENYGTADLLLTEGTTVEVGTDISKFGSAFIQTQQAKCFDIPATKELWCKFDAYLSNWNSQSWYAVNTNSAGKTTGVYKPTGSRLYIEESSSNKSTIRNVLRTQQYQTFLLHMLSSAADGLIEIWVDGEKVGSYSGSVNDGNDFENFYLRTGDADTSNGLFSNVIISDEEIGLDEDATKPDDSKDIEIIADTVRVVTQAVEVSADTTRNISKEQTTLADTQRSLSKNVETFADTARVLAKDIEISADTARIVEKNVAVVLADTVRNVEKTLEINASTVRNIDRSTEILADTKREISLGVEVNADTERIISKSVEISADTRLEIDKTLTVNADTERVVKNSAEFLVEISCDTQRQIEIPVEISADTRLEIEKTVEINCDTARSLPMWLLSMPLHKEGLKSISINLQEQSITDNISYSLASNNAVDFANIGDAVNGNFYNYEFRYNVVETERRGIVQTCECAIDVDEILYTSINYDISDKTGISTTGTGGSNTASTTGSSSNYKLSSVHLAEIAKKLNKNVVFLADDFKTTMELEQQNITYSSLISELFGWTSRIPHKMINCYFRADTLYVIQRGKEPNTIDITNTKHTLPTFKRTLERITWSSEADSKTTVTKKVGGLTFEWTVDLTKEGTDGESIFEYFDNMLSKKTTTHKDGSKSETTYQYKDSDGSKFLYHEQEITTDSEGNSSTTDTFHTSLGQGQRSSTVYKDGEYVTSSVGNTSGDDSASSYIQRRKEIFAAHDVSSTRTIEGNPLIDPSFPLAEDSDLEAVTAQLKWLNRRIREVVTMDIEKFSHVLDFSDLILFEGNYYHLQSNSIQRNERIENRQSISIVRWL